MAMIKDSVVFFGGGRSVLWLDGNYLVTDIDIVKMYFKMFVCGELKYLHLFEKTLTPI